jgi:hypothetical protein
MAKERYRKGERQSNINRISTSKYRRVIVTVLPIRSPWFQSDGFLSLMINISLIRRAQVSREWDSLPPCYQKSAEDSLQADVGVGGAMSATFWGSCFERNIDMDAVVLMMNPNYNVTPCHGESHFYYLYLILHRRDCCGTKVVWDCLSCFAPRCHCRTLARRMYHDEGDGGDSRFCPQ